MGCPRCGQGHVVLRPLHRRARHGEFVSDGWTPPCSIRPIAFGWKGDFFVGSEAVGEGCDLRPGAETARLNAVHPCQAGRCPSAPRATGSPRLMACCRGAGQDTGQAGRLTTRQLCCRGSTVKGNVPILARCGWRFDPRPLESTKKASRHARRYIRLFGHASAWLRLL